MKNYVLTLIIFCSGLMTSNRTAAQIDLNNIDLNDIIGKVMNVKKGFAPKFSLGKIEIPKVAKVAEILGLKRNEQVNRLFNTFKTGRTVYKVASYAGGALAIYGVVKKIGDDSTTSGYKAALTSGLVTIGSGLIVKFLTKAASYKAVDIFNGIATRKIKDIFSIAPASNTMGIGVYVKL
ncbi:MAG: hypothetical protein H0V14_02005 [Chitinophagaceae bacterium]|nr:hypothetical protein [Chitinophagaceae bacterium]